MQPLIIDRHAGPTLPAGALGVQAPRLEIYSHLGIVDQALDLGKRTGAVDLWAQGRRKARVPVGDIGCDLTPYPFVLILGQDGNERLLGDAVSNQLKRNSGNKSLSASSLTPRFVPRKVEQSVFVDRA